MLRARTCVIISQHMVRPSLAEAGEDKGQFLAAEVSDARLWRSCHRGKRSFISEDDVRRSGLVGQGENTHFSLM